MHKVYYIKSPQRTEIVVEDHLITLIPKGIRSTLNKGFSGEKTFRIKDIRSVQLKKPGLTNGYIQFGIAGDGGFRQGVISAVSDENSVMFSKKYYNDMVELKNYIDSYEEVKGSAVVSSNNIADELVKLNELFKSGVLSEDEYIKLKNKLID